MPEPRCDHRAAGTAQGPEAGLGRRGDGPELPDGLEELGLSPAHGVTVAEVDPDANARHVGIAPSARPTFSAGRSPSGTGRLRTTVAPVR